MKRSARRNPKIVIVGAGMSGLCLAIRLKRSGFHDFTIIEKSDEVGGTWYKNSYPNAGCDVPSYLYSYSFAHKFKWSMKYARQPEILKYFRNCADRFGIREHIQFGTSVESAVLDESLGKWRVQTDRQQDIQADVVVHAVGQLNLPHVPEIEGLENFAGQTWHSARWNHDCDLSGKSVAVVGAGASAIQFVPVIAGQTRQTIIFQRSPSWIQPLNNYRYSTWAKLALQHLPFCAGMHRLGIFLTREILFSAFREGSWLNREYARRLRRQMRRLIPPRNWSRLIPDYAPGCKRLLLSNDYLQTLTRNDVDVVTDPILRFENDAVITVDHKHQVDVVIFATGFQANRFLQPMKIIGRQGQSVEDAWAGRPRALLGMATAGFPNMFMLYGPNSNLGHNSIIFMVERQVNYIIRCLKRLRKSDKRLIEVTNDAMNNFDDDVQRRLAASVFSGSCSSWYKSADGSIPNNWWGSALAYWRKTWKPRFSDFQFLDPAIGTATTAEALRSDSTHAKMREDTGNRNAA